MKTFFRGSAIAFSNGKSSFLSHPLYLPFEHALEHALSFHHLQLLGDNCILLPSRVHAAVFVTDVRPRACCMRSVSQRKARALRCAQRCDPPVINKHNEAMSSSGHNRQRYAPFGYRQRISIMIGWRKSRSLSPALGSCLGNSGSRTNRAATWSSQHPLNSSKFAD